MRISRNRLTLRIALIVAIVAVGGIGFRFWQIRQPAYHWQRAQRALASGDLAKSELELRGCLARLPNHGPAHFRLAALLVQRAQSNNSAADYAVVPEALAHLRRTAELLPQQLDVQQTMLRALIAANRLNEAETVATAVQRLDAKDFEAAVLVARQALRRRDFNTVAARLDAVPNPPESLAYNRWWLDFELGRATKNAQRQSAAISAALQRATSSPSEKLPSGAAERGALYALLVLGIETAPDAVSAQRHVEQALKLVAAGPLAPVAGQLGSSLEQRFPAAALSSEDRPARKRIAGQIAEICQQQIAAKEGGSLNAYQYLAEKLVADGDNAQAIQLLKRGLASPAAALAAPRETQALHLLSASLLLSAGRYEEIPKHIEPLLADATTAPQGHMLTGSVALAQARYEDASKEFECAAQRLGPTLPVRLALATTYLALGRAADALPHLQETVAHLDDLSPAEKAWLARYVGDGLALRRALYESLLAVDRAEEATPHLALLRGTPQEPPAQIALAGWHWRHGRQARADAVLTFARQQRPDDIGLTLAHAAVISERGKPEDGDALIGAFAALKPDELPRQLALLQWHVWRGQSAAALEMLPELRQRFGALPLLVSIEAQLLLATDRTQEALAAADKLRAAPQTKSAGSLLAAAAALRLGRTSDAATLLDGAGSGPLVDLFRAKLLSATGQDAAALDLLVSALRYQGAAPQAGAEIGAALDGLAQRQGIQAALQKAGQLLAQKPDDPSLLAAHANLALAAGQADVALADLARLDKILPKTTLVPYLRAQAFSVKGDYDGAAAELDAVLAKDPKHVDARIFAAELARNQGRYAQELQHAEMALLSDPQRSEAALLAADALVRLRRNDEAIAVLTRAIQATPQNPQSYIQLARCYELLGRPNEALQTLAAAQGILPRDFAVLAAQAGTLARGKQFAAAAELVNQRAARHPDAFEPERLGWLMLRLNQYTAARQWGDRFLASAGPHEAETHWLLGNIALLDGNRQRDLLKLAEAESHFRQVLDKFPGHFGATNNLAWLLATDLNQPQQALVLMRKLLERPELKNVPPESLPPTVIDTLAVVLLKADRADEARNLLSRAVQRHPESPNLQYQFGLAHLASRNYTEAETALQTALRLGLEGQEAGRARQELSAIQHQD